MMDKIIQANQLRGYVESLKLSIMSKRQLEMLFKTRSSYKTLDDDIWVKLQIL
jgi:hypothetical protein